MNKAFISFEFLIDSYSDW